MELAFSADTLIVPALLGISSVLLLLASLNDIAWRLLPNRLSVGVGAVGLLLRFLDGTWLMGLMAAAALFLAALLCWHRGWVGGGDVKLLAACALLVPPEHVIDLLMFTAIGGGLIALLYAILGRVLLALQPIALQPGAKQPKATLPKSFGLLRLVQRLWRIECRRIQRHAPIPYGCAISGAALTLLLGPTGPMGS